VALVAPILRRVSQGMGRGFLLSEKLDEPNLLKRSGEPGRTRTCNPLGMARLSGPSAFVFNYEKGKEPEFQKKAEQIRDEMKEKTPTRAKLFEPAE
jgi:hypothetical protein